MALELIEISEDHRRLLEKLCALIPDMEAEDPASLQRIFGLGLIALTMQVTNKARRADQVDLVEELGVLARAIVQSETW